MRPGDGCSADKSASAARTTCVKDRPNFPHCEERHVKIGLIGNGAIAKLVTAFCAERPDRFQIVGALGLPVDKVSVGKHSVVQSWQEFRALGPELVVECA